MTSSYPSSHALLARLSFAAISLEINLPSTDWYVRFPSAVVLLNTFIVLPAGKAVPQRTLWIDLKVTGPNSFLGMAARSRTNLLSTRSRCGIKAHSVLAPVLQQKMLQQDRGQLVKDLSAGFSGAQCFPTGGKFWHQGNFWSQAPISISKKKANKLRCFYQCSIEVSISSTALSVWSLSLLQAVMNPLHFPFLPNYRWFRFNCE